MMSPRVRLRAVGALAVLLSCGAVGHAARPRRSTRVPDLTAGGTKDAAHDWNLGPTGARGWIAGRRLETAEIDNR